jgi:transcription antitermination factor NusG
MLTEKPAWVAVMTSPNVESLVAERFRKAEPPIEYYLPMLVSKDKRFKKDALPEKAMFPCYLFARINKTQVYQTRTTKGVAMIVSIDHSICEVPEKEIEAVRRFEASQRKYYLHESSQLVKGAKAVIVEGEFAGMHGRLVRGCKDGNFCVSISVMHMSFVVKVRRDELKAID